MPHPKPLERYPGVYFVRWGAYVKIGRADDVVSRRRALEYGIPEGSVVALAWIPYSSVTHPGRLEGDLHERFAGHRVRGEWFRYTDEIRDFLKQSGHRWPCAEER
jgi:hypothetical protein